MDKYNIPGMQVLQFSFDDDSTQNINENIVLYTGTHDNETSVQWFQSTIQECIEKKINEKEKRIKSILGKDLNNIHWSMISFCMDSNASIVIFPMQDLLGLGEEGRMNIPGTVGDQNWTWRMERDSIDEKLIKKMSDLTKETYRS